MISSTLPAPDGRFGDSDRQLKTQDAEPAGGQPRARDSEPTHWTFQQSSRELEQSFRTLEHPSTGVARPSRALHVAIIMDGNGRWAQRRHRPRRAGHVAGAAAVRRTVETAPGLGITTLTLYAFSADNWRRPRAEVDHLMRLFQSHVRSECGRCEEDGVRLSIIGRRDRLPAGLAEAIEEAEARTASGTLLHLRIAIDYSARDALTTAATLMRTSGPTSREAFNAALAQAIHAPPGTRDVDLLIRTGGERRLSDFLLWESAYAELVFMDKAWPDFTARDLAAAVREFSTRDRRFGALPPSRDPSQQLQTGRGTGR